MTDHLLSALAATTRITARWLITATIRIESLRALRQINALYRAVDESRRYREGSLHN